MGKVGSRWRNLLPSAGISRLHNSLNSPLEIVVRQLKSGPLPGKADQIFNGDFLLPGERGAVFQQGQYGFGRSTRPKFGGQAGLIAE